MAKEKSVNPAQAHRKKEKEKALKKGKHHAIAGPTIDSLP
jgi:WW domain binding protein 11